MNPTQNPLIQTGTAIATAAIAPPTASSHKLEVLSFPLWGSRLIEASAGTGKTWTIAALYVRLVLGHGQAKREEQGQEQGQPIAPLMPQDILVMTFTRAATRELSDRIRARLTEAAAVFRGLKNHHRLIFDRLGARLPPRPGARKGGLSLGTGRSEHGRCGGLHD